MIASFPSILIVVRAGRTSLHRSWSFLCSQIADIAVSVYDDADWSGADVKYSHKAPGGKFEGIKAFFEEHPSLVEKYDYVMLFEDDLVLPYSSLVRLRELLNNFRFTLASPCLSFDSFFSHPITVQNEKMLFRGTDFVEIMAPIMSREFLVTALPHFDENFSGWGYEWLWRRLLAERRAFAVIVDAAPIVHTRPLGQGSLYRNRPPKGLTAPEEAAALLAKFQLNKEQVFSSLFGVTLEKIPRLLTGDRLLEEMLSGYHQLLGYDFQRFSRCITGLLKARPMASIKQVRGLCGFAGLEECVVSEHGIER